MLRARVVGLCLSAGLATTLGCGGSGGPGGAGGTAGSGGSPSYDVVAIEDQLRRARLIDNEVPPGDDERGLGGAIFVTGIAGLFLLEDSELRRNSACRGGAIYVLNPRAPVRIRNTIVAGNIATDRGGGIYTTGSVTISDGSEVNGNSAVAGGGVYADPDGSVSMTGGEIGGAGLNEGNMAQAGGGIFNFGSIRLDAVLLNANQATATGGGIQQAGESSVCRLFGAGFVVNQAAQSGGGIYVGGGTVTSDMATNFTANTAGLQGGGIFNDGADISGVMASFSLNNPDDIASAP